MNRVLPCLLLFLFAWTGLAPASTCTNTSTGNLPLTELGSGMYQGFQGGLYPGGSNTRPAAFEQAGLAAAGEIQPLDTNGLPDASGRIVLMSVGMSNTNLEFTAFIPVANADPGKNPNLAIVNGAQGGMDAIAWSDPNNPCWGVADSRLQAAGVTRKQVEAIWLKESIAGEQVTEPFPTDAQRLQGLLQTILENAKVRYPNLKIAYVSNRVYAGYGGREPFAYWTGFSVKWLIEASLEGNPAIPWTAWGPYLWADGTTPRQDGLRWVCSDFQSDGIHPASSGQQKVVQLLLRFFKTDPTATPWFLGSTSGVANEPRDITVRILVWPNPMQNEVHIASEGGALPAISIYDVAGRSIRAFPGVELGAGFRWDRRDASGRRVPAGIYFVRAYGAAPIKLVIRE